MRISRKSFLTGLGSLAAASGMGWAGTAALTAAARHAGPPSASRQVTSVDVYPMNIPLRQVMKIAGQPVYHLLGAYRESFETDQTVYLDTPAVMAGKAADIAKKGFRNIKVKLGEGPDIDIERIRTVRDAVGPVVGLRVSHCADGRGACRDVAAVLSLCGSRRVP